MGATGRWLIRPEGPESTQPDAQLKGRESSFDPSRTFSTQSDGDCPLRPRVPRPVRPPFVTASRRCAIVPVVSSTGIGRDLAGKAAGGRKLIAVVYADMVGYSRLIGLDDAGTLAGCARCAAR